MSNGLQIPGQVRIPLQYIQGPTAQPLLIMANGQALCVGGLTKLEQLAGMIASGILTPGVLTGTKPEPPREGIDIRPFHLTDAEFESRVALHSINIAEAILAECERRAKEKQQAQ